jgi:hypothetical protein
LVARRSGRTYFTLVPSTLEAAAEGCRYAIDADDRIVALDEVWFTFAQANGADELARRPGPIGQSLFAFIGDLTTSHLYGTFFDRVRRSGRPLRVPFRCDSPTRRRFLEMEITPAASDGLELRTTVVAVEPRLPVALLQRGRPAGDGILRMCSWCKAVATPERWCEVEEAIVALRLFDDDFLPGISHTICPECEQRVERLRD